MSTAKKSIIVRSDQVFLLVKERTVPFLYLQGYTGEIWDQTYKNHMEQWLQFWMESDKIDWKSRYDLTQFLHKIGCPSWKKKLECWSAPSMVWDSFSCHLFILLSFKNVYIQSLQRTSFDMDYFLPTIYG